MNSKTPDLNLASNLFGALSGEVRSRLVAAYTDPCEQTWDDAYTVILDRETHTTLWLAVIAVDPEFATVSGPVTRWVKDDSPLGGHSEPVSGWSRTPGAEVIRQAIEYATH
jgi:hypothetical protein